jgi:hypothetical protein
MKRALFAALLLVACRQNDDPDGARDLYRRAKSQNLVRAPGWPTRRPSFTAHSREVEIWVNDVVAKTFEPGAPPIKEWPVGSIIYKEGFSGDKRQLSAIMEKRKAGWYWTETDGDGEPIWSASDGKPEICVECHDNRAAYSDWIYSLEFPR